MRRRDYVLAGECAGWILGLPVDTDRGPVTAYAPINHGERKLSFDAVHIGSKLIMPAGQASIIRMEGSGFFGPFVLRGLF